MSEAKHDGELGKHEVSFWLEEFVCIDETDGWKRDESEFVQLTAEQALSLLAWLEGNKTKLEALAKSEEKVG